MLKRVVLYGVAFGSLSASMVLINFFNQLYMHRNALSAIPVLANIFILSFGVYFLVKQIILEDAQNILTETKGVSKEKVSKKGVVEPEIKRLTVGKILFASLTMSLIAAFCNVAAYKHIQTNEPERFQHFKAMQIGAIDAYIAKDTSLTTLIQKKEKRELAISNLEEKLKVGTKATFEIQMYLSLGMIITLLVYIAKKK
jgi:hypothetical protein